MKLCSTMAFIKSSNDARSVWFVSLASRKLGADIEEKSWMSLEQALGEMCVMYGATLLRMMKRVGYMVSSLPLLVVMRVWIDCSS